jgi:hypothetical protein
MEFPPNYMTTLELMEVYKCKERQATDWLRNTGIPYKLGPGGYATWSRKAWDNWLEGGDPCPPDSKTPL